MKSRFLLLFAFFMCLAWTASAQITTSSMMGSVRGEDGMGMIGAIIEATHTPSGTVYATTVSGDGFYNLPNMRVGGPYQVVVTYVGYKTETFDNITLALGVPYKLNVVLYEEGVLLGGVDIVVRGGGLMDSKRTGASTTLSSETINALPTITRNINDFTRLTPQSNGTSFAGRDNRFNNYTVDGNIYNNNFGLGSGQFAGTNPISLDAIEEVQVNLAPFDIRQGGFTGANVNAITRAGTNNWEGSAYFYIRNDQLQGDRVIDQRLNRGESQNLIYGARVGGPIIKNKLFFFASFEQETEQVPSFQKRALREGETPDPFIISRVPASQLEFVGSELQRLYGYDAGPFEDYPFASEALRINARLDYNINKNHKAFIRFNRYSAFRDVSVNGNSIRFLPNSQRFLNTNRFGIEAMNFRNSHYSVDNNVNSIAGELNSMFGSKISNSLNVGFTMIEDPKRSIPGGQDFPFIEVLEPDAGGNLLYYMTMGNELFSVGNLMQNNIFNVMNTTSYYMGRHTFTGGVNFEYMTFDNAFNPAFNSVFRYNSYDNFVRAVIQQDPTVQPDAWFQSFAFDGSTTPPTDQTRFAQLGLFLQDEYRVSDRLTVTAGLRVDLPFYPIDLPVNERLLEFELTDPVSGKTLVPDVSQLPKVNPLFSPRLSFNYDVLGDNKLKLRGGTGIFSGRLPFVWISNQVNGNGVTRGGTGFWTPEQFAENPRPFSPDVNAYRPGAGELEAELSNEVNFTDRDFRLPQVWRTSLAADYELPGGIVATLEGIYTRDVVTPIATNLVLPEADGMTGGPGSRPTYSTTTTNEQFNQAFYLTNAQSNGDYFAATVKLEKSFTNGFWAMLAYTRSRSRDYGLEGGSQAISLWANTVQFDRNNPEISFTRFDRPNRVVGALSYSKGTSTVTLFYDGGNGDAFASRYSYTYSYANAGVGNRFAGANLLMYVPNNASELQFEQFTTAAGRTFTVEEQRAALDAYIDQSAYLSSKRGQIVERNGALLPWLNRFDLRILQDIPLTDKHHKLQISLDILNIGNLLNPNWGIARTPFQRNLLSIRGFDENNVPIYRANFIPGTTELPSESVRPVVGLSQTWTAQFGLRYIF